MDQDSAGHRTHCIRCGKCCIDSSPTLQMIDLPLVYEGQIKRSDLFTLRVGELVRDNIRARLKVTDKEIIKVREKEKGGGCIFYDEAGKACTTYENRPIQCVALACWDESEFMRVYKRPKAGRPDIIRDKNLLRILFEHEKRCAYAELDRCVRRIEREGEKAVEKILDMLKFDHNIRLLTIERLGIEPDEMDFILGRPLSETITMFGLKVVREPEGSFFLTMVDDSPFSGRPSNSKLTGNQESDR